MHCTFGGRATGVTGAVDLDLRPGHPLIRMMAIARNAGEAPRAIIENVDPVTFLVVGTRQAPTGRPPGMSVFNVFFDNPASRPFEQFRGEFQLRRVNVASQGHRATISLGDIVIGPFKGELRLTFYQGASLVHVETVVQTQRDRTAILYDTGLAFSAAQTSRFAWIDTEGVLKRQNVAANQTDQSIAVRHRTLVLETRNGAVACFPPPHQFFSPRDFTDNLKTVWLGRDHRGLEPKFGFGIGQAERGGGNFVPWFNAPPGTEQRLGVFYLLSDGDAGRALKQTLRYTHGDRYPELAGYHTFTSHWHMATAMAAEDEKREGRSRTTPDLVSMFKDMGVDIVHLAEFHGDGHPQDPGPVRLAEMAAMFDECKRLSQGGTLFLPGEEANIGLGPMRPGKEAGHWLYLFPKPVYWTMRRAPNEPFVNKDPRLGPIYHVGDGFDMVNLLQFEHGLAWTSHARIKGSSWTPDIFRNQPFFKSNLWLGAAWKAMPADLSAQRLGGRALDLLDDMANWGDRKYLPGEVDVFKIDHTHELFGHMNINYLRLEPNRVPRFDESWQPVLDALRGGRFFVTTGEILIPEFTVAAQPSGSTVELPTGGSVEIRATMSWTFPLRFVELVSGDGERVFRERIELADTEPFGERTLTHRLNLAGRTWVRMEVWDIATNGAFTQPVWLKPSR